MTAGFDIAQGRLERTAPFLKTSQVEDMAGEEKRIAETINAPPHLRNSIQDRSQLVSTLNKLRKSLDRDTARAYSGNDLDKAVKRERELREKFVADMPTQAEMRRNPPGAVDKHLAFEAKHADNIDEWKNIRRRLSAAGALPDGLSERSLSNIEMFRPAGGSGEMSMDNAQIPQVRSFHGLGGRSSPLNAKELALLEILAPDIFNKLALLSADDRDELKGALEGQSSGALNFDTMTHKEAREHCRAADLDTGGSKEDLIGRLKAHAGAAEKAA